MLISAVSLPMSKFLPLPPPPPPPRQLSPPSPKLAPELHRGSGTLELEEVGMVAEGTDADDDMNQPSVSPM
jgi:hypothetical protein